MRHPGASWKRGRPESAYSIGTILTPNGKGVIAEVFCGDDSDEENRAESEADFTLLLAAPRMAKLLESFVAAFEGDPFVDLSRWLQKARDILRALGRL